MCVCVCVLNWCLVADLCVCVCLAAPLLIYSEFASAAAPCPEIFIYFTIIFPFLWSAQNFWPCVGSFRCTQNKSQRSARKRRG